MEDGPLNQRREQLSEWLDSTDPDLSAFYQRGGKMIVTIGTDDTLASPGATRLLPSRARQDGAGTGGRVRPLLCIATDGSRVEGKSSATNGDGESVTAFPIPNQFDKTALITAGWSATKLRKDAGRNRRGAQPAAVFVSGIIRGIKADRRNPRRPTRAPRRECGGTGIFHPFKNKSKQTFMKKDRRISRTGRMALAERCGTSSRKTQTALCSCASGSQTWRAFRGN